jgi:hypothetical protein
MADYPKSPGLVAPDAADLRTFKINRQMATDTVETFLKKGWSLAVCCRSCGRLAEKTPPELEAIFSGKLKTTIADVLPRLACKGDGGCGSTDVAVWPHAYEHPWTWPPKLL